jgi:hypothetical protein
MLTEVYSKQIKGAADMSEFEAVVARVMGCEQCSFMRSQDYLRFRIGALYRAELEEPLESYGERVKVRLDCDRIATVYLLEDTVPPEALLGRQDAPHESDDEQEPEKEAVLGKRDAPEWDDEPEPAAEDHEPSTQAPRTCPLP